MPIKTRNLFSRQEGPPDVQAAEYQLALARAMQQQAMRPNVPLAGGPVQATYGVGQGLVDLATALTSAYNVKKSEGAYKRAQEAQAAQAQAQQRQALDAMLGGQNAGDGMGPPTPTPGYEQTIGLAQGAINAGVSPELAKALLEARKPKAPREVDLGDQIGLMDASGQIVGVLPKGATPDAALRERGESTRWQTPSANTRMTTGATLRGQDVGAATQRRGQDMTAATARETNAGLGKPQPGYRWNADGSQEPIPGGPQAAAATKAANEARSTSPDAVWNMYQTARNGMMRALEQTSTGPIVGRIPAITASQQTAQGGVSAMAPVLKQLFRVAGEGVFTDRDQALLLEMVPDRTDLPAARDAKMVNIDAIVRAKLGFEAQNGPQSGGASGSFGDPALDDIMRRYGGQ
jgi:hypothetical protein